MGMMVGVTRGSARPGVYRALACALGLVCAAAGANTDSLDSLVQPGDAGIGFMMRVGRSPYRGDGTRYDFVPLYLYEGERLYLRSTSIGLKFRPSEMTRFDVFLRNRFEGHPIDDIPPSLTGMAPREHGIDGGVSGQLGGAWGVAFVELLRDVSKASKGKEARLGYNYPVRRGRLWVRPQVVLSRRDSDLNNYYFGVLPEEARADRPAYEALSGVMAEFGVQAAYELTTRWRVLGAVTVARLPDTVTGSPIVDQRTLRQVQLGLLYGLSPEHERWPEARPLIARALYGASTDCNVIQVATLQCTSIHTKDPTGIAGLEVGRPFIERLNGWPLDLAAFVGLTQHLERGLQGDFPEVKAYIKAYFYGFPWDARLRTRLGLGIGLSYAQEIPFSEQQSQTERGRNTSRLLNTFDPTVDLSLGGLLGARSLRDTYIGVGVSHRSGIFGSAQLLGNVNGGSNYIYSYLETSF